MNIAILSSIPWSFLWQRPQHIASLLAKKGHKVVYYDTPTYLSISSYLEKTRNNKSVEIEEVGNVSVVRISLPNLQGTFAPFKNILFKRAFKSSLETVDFHPDVSIFYSLHFVPLIKTLDGMDSKITYDCVDDSLSFPEFATSKYKVAEIELIKSSSVCIATSKFLVDKVTQFNPRCTYLPNAMDFEHFYSVVKGDKSNINPEVSSLKHPVIGFIGAVFDWIDVDLICKLAELHHEYTILLVGPVNHAKEKLDFHPNIVMIGTKPYETLPSYLSNIDVCLIPFKINSITLASNPIKMYEYLAAGKPVVSTALPEVVRNASRIVYIGKDDEDFVRKVEAAVKESNSKNEAAVIERLEFAKNNSWESRVEIIEQLLKEVIVS
jgi:O-antigen biosynthesis protein